MFMTYEDLRRNVPEIERILGYTFRDKSLLMQAFTRSSWCNENGGGYQSNEVLEFFGDSVLSAVIVSFLFSLRTERYRYGIRTELGEGDFSNIKSKLSDKTNLSRSTKKLGLEKYLLMGEGDVKLGIKDEPSVMEDLFESIVGAVYIDTGKDIPTVTSVVSKILDMSVYADSRAPEVSPKNALQEWCADKKRRLPAPVYKTLEERGPDHKKVYVRGVYIGERLVAAGEGKNQKTADAKAAEEALLRLRSEQESATADVPAVNNPKNTAKPDTAAKVATAKEPKSQKSQEPKAPKDEKPSKNSEPVAQKESKASKKPEPKAVKDAKPQKNAEPVAQKESKSPKSPEPKANGETPKGASQGSPSPLALLKKHAQQNRVDSPAFRDLGTFSSGEEIEYHIECSYMGKRVIASGESRIGARESAALLIAKELKII